MKISQATVLFTTPPQFTVNGQSQNISQLNSRAGDPLFDGVYLGNNSFARVKKVGGKYHVDVFNATDQNLTQTDIKIDGGAVIKLKTDDGVDRHGSIQTAQVFDLDTSFINQYSLQTTAMGTVNPQPTIDDATVTNLVTVAIKG